VAAYADYLRGAKPLRVGLVRSSQSAWLRMDSPAAIIAAEATGTSTSPVHLEAGDAVQFSRSADAIVASRGGGEVIAQGMRLLISSDNPAATAAVGASPAVSGRYAGAFEAIPGASGVSLVNVIDLERYVLGVLPGEMPETFQPEALRAQAILARTYALYHLGAHASEGFDLCADVDCQVYRGGGEDRPKSAAAVRTTAGQVLTYHGILADAVYHSTCGGATAAGWEVWEGAALPYLVGGVDGPEDRDLSTDAAVRAFLQEHSTSFCRDSQKYRWQQQYTLADGARLVKANLGTVIERPGLDPGDLQDLAVTERAPHGRVQTLQIVTTMGAFTVHRDSIRWLFGTGRAGRQGLPSTLFALDVTRDQEGQATAFVFRGAGWGHGLGLCQWGAEGRAKAGATAEQLLAAYYPGTEIYSPKQTDRPVVDMGRQ
jgi:stage II sporulation protein D